MDIFLTICSVFITFLLALLGVYVSLEPLPEDRRIGWLIMFCALGFFGVLLIVFQAQRNIDEKAKLQSRLEEHSASIEKVYEGVPIIQGKIDTATSPIHSDG